MRQRHLVAQHCARGSGGGTIQHSYEQALRLTGPLAGSIFLSLYSCFSSFSPFPGRALACSWTGYTIACMVRGTGGELFFAVDIDLDLCDLL